MRIMIDLDNTLTDYTGALRDDLLTGRHHLPLDGYAMSEPATYELWKDGTWPFASWEEQAHTHRAAVGHGLYLHELPYPHAMRALWQFIVDGHDLVIATSRADDDHFRQTFDWFDRHWFDPAHGPTEYDVAFHFGDKTLLDVDIAFEDDPHTISTLTAKGITVIHPNHPYCRDSTGITMSGWQQAADIIRRLDTKAHA